MQEVIVKKIRTVYLFAFMASFALSHTVFSILLPRIIDNYDLNLSVAGYLPAFMGFGGLVAMLTVSFLGDRFRKNVLVCFSYSLLILAIIVISFLPQFTLLVVLIVILGMSISLLNVTISAYISDLYQEQRSRYMSLLHVFFGIGSLAGPLIPSLTEHLSIRWQHTYLFLGILFSFVFASYLFFNYLTIKGNKVQDYKQKSGDSLAVSRKSMFSYPGMKLLCLISFLYMGGHQSAFSVWLPTYLTTRDPAVYTISITGVIMTTYWIGIVAGRFVYSLLANKLAPRTYIISGCLIGAVVQVFALSVNHAIFWLASVVVLGLFTGAIYPLTLSIGCQWFPNNSASVTSFVGIFSSAGNMVLLWLVGQVAEFAGFHYAMMIPVISLILVLLINVFGLKSYDEDSSASVQAQAVTDR